MSLRLALAVVATLAMGCAKQPPVERFAESTEVQTPPHRTTSEAIFATNLDTKIAVLRADVARDPMSARSLAALSRALYRQAMYRGDLVGIDEAIRTCTRAIKAAPGQGDLYLLRAQQQLSLHRVVQARGDIERAAALGAADPSLTAELEYGTGDLRTSVEAIRAAARRSPNVKTLTRMAVMEHELGRHAVADEAFSRAHDLAKTTDPIVIAWLEVQHGHHHLVLGRLAKAEALFQSAVSRAPNYILAVEHLAETVAKRGRRDESIALYESVVARSDNPEFMHALAEQYRLEGRTTDADRLRDRAELRYEALLAAFPQAMSWHAAQFFLTEGDDPARAVELLTRNAELRPTSQALVALAEAHLAVIERFASDSG